MKTEEQQEIHLPSSAGPTALQPVRRSGQLRSLVFFSVVLVLCFGKPLCDLVRFAAKSELYSYILLVPFISCYLIWLKRRNLPVNSEPDRKWALLPWSVGSLTVAAYWFAVHSGLKLADNDYLAGMAFSFVLFLIGIGFLCLGKNTLRALAFPIGFLIFLIPFPTFLKKEIEGFLQRASAESADVLFSLSGTPFVRQDMAFQLPGFSLQVAPECSGIHSTMVLFLTSLIAGQLFLCTPWKRAVLALAILPLALLRNGLRILTIGELCVHVSPDMIHSYIHRRGGPIFFALSLLPFFLLVYLFRKSEAQSHPASIVKTEF